ncbi:hypothetical protein LTR78_003948 [Recurvomyces mirabilis]|uniref:Uncharacterized protein n=1 Tax=Recurvomyces mirabilis TaxID=574656 RepID=A0AAE1C2Z9_9PEZI|nr:hypothetical protein LTR78_003948 [Recurvomyces mirabilis]KAK5153914.1 hypothetical protein LTS14_007134 [Recurvomyces mirabilis]
MSRPESVSHDGLELHEHERRKIVLNSPISSMPRRYSRDSAFDDDGKQPVVKRVNKCSPTAQDDLPKKRWKRESVRWHKTGQPVKTTYRDISEQIPKRVAGRVAATPVLDDVGPLELVETPHEFDDVIKELEACLPDPTVETNAAITATLDIKLDGLFEKDAALNSPYREDDNPNAARSWRADCTRFQSRSSNFEPPALVNAEAETEAGYLPEDLYNFEQGENDDACFSTITTTPNTDTGLALYAKPSTNAGRNSHDLYQIQYVWRGAVEDPLLRTLQPSGPATHWDRKLIRALARIAYYGTAHEINRLLWQKVSERGA